jgi:small conductance mechanosensitive channel
MIKNFLKNFHISLSAFVDYLPALLGGIVCFILTIVLANVLSKIVAKYSKRRTKDSLIANFLGKIIWAVIFILGTVLALGILGLGTISNKILAGAGITTFVVGFALKDIGENFLAGLVLAFSRPYRVGGLIECEGIKGVVMDMTLRQTTVESDDGKTVLIPNSSIIKNPLFKYQNRDNLNQEFSLSVDVTDARKAMQIIDHAINSFDYVMRPPGKQANVIADSLSGDKLKLTATFWFDTTKFKSNRLETKSEIMIEVFNQLQKAGIKFNS